jgi:hypothetical protein
VHIPLAERQEVNEMTNKITETVEHDAAGNVIKRIITVGNDHQSSIELNYNAKKEVSSKIKVYQDDPAEMESKLKAFKEIAERVQ